MRVAILAGALTFIAILTALTVVAVISGGVNVLTVLTLLVLVLLGFGVVGALLHPPPEDLRMLRAAALVYSLDASIDKERCT